MAQRNIFNIESFYPFADNLVSGILKRYGADPLKLSDILLLLPNRRSIKSVKEAFLRCSGGKPILLPRMMPIGDLGSDDQSLFATPEIIERLPKVMSNIDLRLILTRLIDKWQSYQTESHVQAAHLAIELASFLSEVNLYKIAYEDLEEIVPHEFAVHWQMVLQFLKILFTNWPEILKEHNALDVVSHRNLALELQSEFWDKNKPAFPIIIAGTTGSVPATVKLIKSVIKYQHCMLVLPGLDMNLPDGAFQYLTESHPQFGLYNLLKEIGTSREVVTTWTSNENVDDVLLDRFRFLSNAMLPAAIIDEWDRQKDFSKDLFKGVSFYNCETPRSESELICFKMREVLEEKGKTAALITDDSDLARNVSILMARWDIKIDNSAGQPLSDIPAAVFMRLINEVVFSRAAPVSLLKLLKHPLSAFNNQQLVMLEKRFLRGVRSENGFSSLKQEINESAADDLYQFVSLIETCLNSFLQVMGQSSAPLSTMIEMHIAAMEALANRSTEDLWSDDKSEQLKEFLTELLSSAKSYGIIDVKEYPAFFDAMLVGQTYRPKYGMHPRLTILTPIEARMLSFDRVILAGMNEGTWPDLPKSGPWMSRPMRGSAGLPMPEKRVGQKAHDFIQLCMMNEVIVTRSLKVAGTPAIASRWLRLVEIYAAKLGFLNIMETDSYKWQKLLRKLNMVDKIAAIEAPKPCPPLVFRPLKLSVTSIEKLMRDPYSIYASKILKLKKLDPLDQDPGALEFGNFIHKVLDEFVREFGKLKQDEYYSYIIELGQKKIKEFAKKSQVILLWWPRFERIAGWFVNNEITRCQKLNKVITESWGQYKINVLGVEFILSAKADRIDLDNRGNISIIDYKTGNPPKIVDVLNGLSPQMALEAMIMHHGGFDDLKNQADIALEFWSLKGGNEVARLQVINKDIVQLISTTKAGFLSLINCFMNENTPYLAVPDPDAAPNYSDYEHLERIKEWR